MKASLFSFLIGPFRYWEVTGQFSTEGIYGSHLVQCPIQNSVNWSQMRLFMALSSQISKNVKDIDCTNPLSKLLLNCFCGKADFSLIPTWASPVSVALYSQPAAMCRAWPQPPANLLLSTVRLLIGNWKTSSPGYRMAVASVSPHSRTYSMIDPCSTHHSPLLSK